MDHDIRELLTIYLIGACATAVIWGSFVFFVLPNILPFWLRLRKILSKVSGSAQLVSQPVITVNKETLNELHSAAIIMLTISNDFWPAQRRPFIRNNETGGSNSAVSVKELVH